MIVFSTIQEFASKLVKESNSSSQARKKTQKEYVKRNCTKLIQGEKIGGIEEMVSCSMLLGSFVLFCLRFVQHKDKFLLTTHLSPKLKNKKWKQKYELTVLWVDTDVDDEGNKLRAITALPYRMFDDNLGFDITICTHLLSNWAV